MNITYEFVHTSNTGAPLLIVKVNTAGMNASEIRDAIDCVRATNLLYQYYKTEGTAAIVPTHLPTNFVAAQQARKDAREQESAARAMKAAEEAKKQNEAAKIHSATDKSGPSVLNRTYMKILGIDEAALAEIFARIEQEFATRSR